MTFYDISKFSPKYLFVTVKTYVKKWSQKNDGYGGFSPSSSGQSTPPSVYPLKNSGNLNH